MPLEAGPQAVFVSPVAVLSPPLTQRSIFSAPTTHSKLQIPLVFLRRFNVAENTPLISLVSHSVALIFFSSLKLFLKGSKIISFLYIFKYTLKETD